MPKFHRLAGDKIVELDDFTSDPYRENPICDRMVVRDAHPAIVDPLARRAAARAHAGAPAHRLLECANCGDALFGTRRTRKKVVAGAGKIYVDLLYVCAGSIRAKVRCRQVSLPCDGLERAALRILDEEVFSAAGIERLEQAMREGLARRSRCNVYGDVEALERRERELAHRLADGARRLLQVDETLVVEVKAALAELKDEHARVRAARESKQRTATLVTDAEAVVRQVVDGFRSMARVLRDPTFPLERRKEILRRFLPAPDGRKPIRIEIDVNGGRGWQRALRRVTVRHLSIRKPDCQASVVAGGVSFEAGQLDGAVWDPVDELPTWERELVPADLVECLGTAAAEPRGAHVRARPPSRRLPR